MRPRRVSTSSGKKSVAHFRLFETWLWALRLLLPGQRNPKASGYLTSHLVKLSASVAKGVLDFPIWNFSRTSIGRAPIKFDDRALLLSSLGHNSSIRNTLSCDGSASCAVERQVPIGRRWLFRMQRKLWSRPLGVTLRSGSLRMSAHFLRSVSSKHTPFAWPHLSRLNDTDQNLGRGKPINMKKCGGTTPSGSQPSWGCVPFVPWKCPVPRGHFVQSMRNYT